MTVDRALVALDGSGRLEVSSAVYSARALRDAAESVGAGCDVEVRSDRLVVSVEPRAALDEVLNRALTP